MITVITATNRPNNISQLVANYAFNLFLEKECEAAYYSLEYLPPVFATSEIFGSNLPEVKTIQEKYILPSQKLLFVVPEYNGSFAGILKLFLEGFNPKIWHGKKAAIIGIAAGRAGNVVGMEHLVSVLNYLQMVVMPQKLPISRVNDLILEGKITDKVTLDLISQQVDRLIAF